MQWLAALCVRRPVFATVLILLLTVVGAFAFTQLGVDRLPKVDFPTIVVTTRNPGAAPEEIETEVSDKIEEAVNTISGIDELRSTSAEGVSIVSVTFLLEKDVEVAAQEVRDRVNRVLPLLPRTIRQPTVEKMDPDASPIITLVVSAPRAIRDISEYADKVLRRQLESVDGVGQVMILGSRPRQVNISADAARLRANNLTVTDLARALQAQNLDVPGGRVELGPETLTLRTQGRVRSVEGFGDIVVRDRSGHPVRVADVATVEDGMADVASVARLDGVPAVVMPIRRQSGTNAVEVVDRIKGRLEELRAGGAVPPGFEIRVVRDQSIFIKASIASVEEHLVLGSLLAALVVLVFLWNVRSTAIAAVAIPTSIVATFGLIWYEGFTLNMMTMLALTLSVGIVIDDAIVVLENIYRFIEEKGRPPMQAAVEATKEIGLAVLATTLSLVAIFLPVGFMGGMVGKFMKSFGLTMAFAVMVSLLVSFTLTPMLGARWLRKTANGNGNRGSGHGSRDSRFFRPIDRRYTAVLHWALGHRGTVAAIAILVLLSSVPLALVAPKNFMPIDDQSEFEVGIRAPEGTSLQATEVVANRVAARIRDQVPEAEYTLVTVADDSANTSNLANIYIRLSPIEARDRDQFAIMADVRSNILVAFRESRLRTMVRQSGGMGGGGAQSSEIQYVLNGPSLATLRDSSAAVAKAARALPGVVDVDTSLNLGKPELGVRIDRGRAADLGVQLSDAAEALRLLVGGDQVTTYNEGGEQYEVRVRAAAADRTTEEALALLTVPSSRHGSIALDQLATFERSEAASEIMRLGRERQVTVYASLLPGVSQTPVMAAMEAVGEGLKLGPSYRARFAGRSRELGRAATNFLLAFVLSLIFMYLILAAQFESWLHPVTILLSLPLTLPFALLSVLVTGQSLNVMSALGLLVLFGVVKKNSILQIDHANQLREAGMERHAAVVQASRDRLRPILMTTFAFVAGMIPLVVSGGVGSGTNRAIGFIIIGGQTLVLVLTLVVTPVAYSLFDDLRELRPWRRRGRAAVAAAGPAAVALAAILALPAAASAQMAGATAAAQVAEAQAAGDTKPSLRLTLDAAAALALEHNPDIVVERLDPAVSAERVSQANSAFLPSLASAFTRNSQLQPPTSFLVGLGGVQNDGFSGSLTLSQRLPWYGSSYAVSWDGSRSTSTSTFANFNPSLNSRLQVSLSQPLLKDLALDSTRQQLILARRNKDITDTRFRETVVRTLASVKRAYWDLVAARALVEVQRQSFALSEELVRIDKARVAVGQMPDLDLFAAQADLAQRQEAITIAEVTARQAEDRLRTLILDPGDAGFWQTSLDLTDRPVPPVAPDLDGAVRAALDSRQDLRRARLELENARTSVKYYSSQRLPDLRLQGNYQGVGLAGTRVIRTGGFPGTVSGQELTAFSTALEQVFRRDYPAWTVGISVSYPLGRSSDEAGLATARLQEAQARTRLQSLEVRIVRQIRQSAWQLEMNTRRIETSRAARDFQERRVQAEQKRFEVGLSTSFLVLQAQRDLAQARNNELSAQLDYIRSLTDFEALQEASLETSGSTVSVTGSSVTSPGAVPATSSLTGQTSTATTTRVGGL